MSPAAAPGGRLAVERTPAAACTVGRVEPDQSYYWTDEWQADERAAVDEIRSGTAKRFETADDAIRWLTT